MKIDNTKKKLIKIANIIGSIFTFIVVSAVLLLLFVKIIKNEDGKAVYSAYVVGSDSMKPALYKGDLIIGKYDEDLIVGDIITFKAGGDRTITHRISGFEDSGLIITKGDFNATIDVDRVNPDDVIGTFLYKIPLFGYFIDFIQQPVGLILVVIIPSIGLIGLEIAKIQKEIDKMRNQKSESKLSSILIGLLITLPLFLSITNPVLAIYSVRKSISNNSITTKEPEIEATSISLGAIIINSPEEDDLKVELFNGNFLE